MESQLKSLKYIAEAEKLVIKLISLSRPPESDPEEEVDVLIEIKGLLNKSIEILTKT